MSAGLRVRDLIAALEFEDPERMVVVPIAKAKTARELVGVKEVSMNITRDGNYIPTNDDRTAFGQATVLALIPEAQGK